MTRHRLRHCGLVALCRNPTEWLREGGHQGGHFWVSPLEDINIFELSKDTVINQRMFAPRSPK